MSTTAAEAPKTKVVTGLVRLSYANLFTPTAMEEGQEKKYNVTLLIPKKDKETVAKIKAAQAIAIEVGKTKFGDKWVAKKDKMALRDGDEKDPEDENYTNHFYVSAKSVNKPGIVDKDLEPIMDQEEVYSGCYAKVSINFFPYKQGGIACGLQNLMKVKDGEPFSSRSSAKDDFSGMVVDTDDDDLM